MSVVLYPPVQRPLTLQNLRKAYFNTGDRLREHGPGQFDLRVRVTYKEADKVYDMPGFVHRLMYSIAKEATAPRQEIGRIEAFAVEVDPDWFESRHDGIAGIGNYLRYCTGCGAPLSNWICNYCKVIA